jgi:hypothetical protein
MTSTRWVNGYPCVWVYDCMLSQGYIPSELKMLLLISSYDPVVLAYSSSLSTGTDQLPHSSLSVSLLTSL